MNGIESSRPAIITSDAYGNLSSRSVLDSRLAVKQLRTLLTARFTGTVSFEQPLLVNRANDQVNSDYVSRLTCITPADGDRHTFTVVTYAVERMGTLVFSQSFQLSGLDIVPGHLDCAAPTVPAFVNRAFGVVTEALVGHALSL